MIYTIGYLSVLFLIGHVEGQIVFPGHVERQSPTLTLYTEVDQQGAKFTVTGPHHDLRTDDFNDVTKSICGRGLWFLYDDVDFKRFVHQFASSHFRCQNLDQPQRDQVSSLRYAGADDMSMETLTLYHDTNQCGGNYLALGDIDRLQDFNDVASSFAITGDSSWTVYRDDGYDGGGACMTPDEVDGFFYGSWNYDEIGMDNDAVSSLRKGCHSTYQPSKSLNISNTQIRLG